MLKRIIFLLALSIFTLTGCTHEIAFTEIHPDDDLMKVNQISILDGSNGRRVNSQDEELIRNMTELLSQFQLRTYRTNDESDGYQYAIVFCRGDEKIFGVATDSYNRFIIIDGDLYTVVNTEIYSVFTSLAKEQLS